MASGFNSFTGIGNLTRDPELKHIGSGTAVCTIGLAISKQWYDKKTEQKREATTFIDVVFWGKGGEVINEHMKKGSPLFVSGTLDMDQWEDKTTGQKRSKHYVTCNEFKFIGGKDGGSRGGGNDSSMNQDRGDSGMGGNQVAEDDVPF